MVGVSSGLFDGHELEHFINYLIIKIFPAIWDHFNWETMPA
jgi:hypothetical protein